LAKRRKKLARDSVSYSEAIALATSGMTYVAFRDALRAAGVNVVRTIDAARSRGDLQFYNVRNAEGRLETRIALRDEPIPAEG